MTDHENIKSEQFWFTATMLGVNYFILEKTCAYDYFVIIPITILNVLAMYLILQRSAAHSKSWDSKKNRKEKFKIIIREICEIFKDFSGSLFYFLLILFPFLAIILRFILGLRGVT